MKTSIRGFLFLFLSFFAKAQEVPKYQYDQMLWFGYYNTTEFTKKWNLGTDIQVRTKGWHKNFSQVLFRTGLIYRVNEKFNVTLGLAHFRFFLTDERTRGEWRPWQEVGHNCKWRKMKISQRLRLEERFNQKVFGDEILNDYNFNYRLRYRFELRWPIFNSDAQRNLHLVTGNEFMLNAGESVKNTFDQDRLYIGLQADLNKKLSVQFQYMHIWQLQPNGITLTNLEVLRFNIYHNISL